MSDYRNLIAVTNRHLCKENLADRQNGANADQRDGIYADRQDGILANQPGGAYADEEISALLQQIDKILPLHPEALILREKDLTDSEYEELAKKVLVLCEKENVPCFLHSHADIARKLGCKRIHIPAGVLIESSGSSIDTGEGNISSTSTDIGKGKISGSFGDFSEVSVSCHRLEEIDEVVRCGATRIVLGNIFETGCKPGLEGKGLEFLKKAADRSPVPVYAIGGITPENLPEVLSAGAAGGCMMSGFMKI